MSQANLRRGDGDHHREKLARFRGCGISHTFVVRAILVVVVVGRAECGGVGVPQTRERFAAVRVVRPLVLFRRPTRRGFHLAAHLLAAVVRRRVQVQVQEHRVSDPEVEHRRREHVLRGRRQVRELDRAVRDADGLVVWYHRDALVEDKLQEAREFFRQLGEIPELEVHEEHLVGFFVVHPDVQLHDVPQRDALDIRGERHLAADFFDPNDEGIERDRL